jgi:hypothetical protein
MNSLFESLFTTKDIIRKKYPTGWNGWLNDGMSDKIQGELTRCTTMDGLHMHKVVNDLINYGFEQPELIDGVFHFKDYYLDVHEYYHYIKEDISKHSCKAPEWLQIKPQPKMSIMVIAEKELDINDYNGSDYSYLFKV